YVVAATGEPGAAPGGQIVVALDAVPDRAEDLDDFPVDMSLARELSWTAVLDLPATAGAGNGEPSIRPLFGVMIDDEEVIPFVVGSGTNAHLTYPVLGPRASETGRGRSTTPFPGSSGRRPRFVTESAIVKLTGPGGKIPTMVWSA